MTQHAVCDLCGGTLVDDTTSLHLWHDTQLVIISDVPATTCRQCGQSHVDSAIADRIEQFLQRCGQCEPRRYLQVPEFSASQILQPES